MTKNSVADRSPPQKEHEKDLAQIRALMGGTKAMRKAATKYLPRDAKEDDKDYGVRLLSSFLYPGYSKTVHDLADKVFAKEIQFGKDVPKEITGTTNEDGKTVQRGWAEDIDMLGRNLNNFSHDLLVDGLQAGISFVHVDMPKQTKENPTIADEQRPASDLITCCSNTRTS